MRPGLANSGVMAKGVNLPEWFHALADRLREVDVLCKPWDGKFPKVLLDANPCGVFLDPPYATPTRDGLYTTNDMTVALDVQRWAIEQGTRPGLRMAVCGYQDDYEPWPDGWDAVVWKESSGTWGHGKGKAVRGHERLETIWFSPQCLPAPEVFSTVRMI